MPEPTCLSDGGARLGCVGVAVIDSPLESLGSELSVLRRTTFHLKNNIGMLVPNLE